MSLTFYYAPRSTAIVTKLILEELGVPHETVQLDLAKGDTKTAEFLKLNPNGKVPTIVHDGAAIWESSAITMYLGETFGVAKGLYPEPGPRRGEAMKWIAWTNVTLAEAVARWIRNTLESIPADQRNAKVAEAAERDIAVRLEALDAALDGRPYLVGDYTLADAHVNSLLDWMRYNKVDFSPYAHLNAWSARCAARPAYAKVMAGAMG